MMVSDPVRRRELLQKAEALATALGEFKSPHSNDPVDPSRLAEVMRFVKTNGTRDLPEMLKLLPGSYLRKASATSTATRHASAADLARSDGGRGALTAWPRSGAASTT